LIAGGAFVAGALVAYAWYLFVHHRRRGFALSIVCVLRKIMKEHRA
jgi:VIT1/CCC1 family predicted Fe2+/Mn2+ transporter